MFRSIPLLDPVVVLAATFGVPVNDGLAKGALASNVFLTFAFIPDKYPSSVDVTVDEDYKAALYSYALSVSDNYWFRPKHSKLKYNELKFKDDSYFDAALKGLCGELKDTANSGLAAMPSSTKDGISSL